MVNKPMDELIDQMKVVLADTFAMYLKAHMFHWNVTGPNFPQLHEFFGDLYEELHGAVDPIAEQIRTLVVRLSFAASYFILRMAVLRKIKQAK